MLNLTNLLCKQVAPYVGRHLFPQTGVVYQQRSLSVFSSEPEIFDSGKLEDNLKVARVVNDYVSSKITKVGTWGIEPPITKEKLHEFIEFDEQINKMRELKDFILRKQPPQKMNEFVSAALSAYMANKSGYGNCGEMGALGLMYLSEAGWQGRAGTFEIRRPKEAPLPNGLLSAKSRTHTFLIIGLGANSKIKENDFQSFGINSVVCDPYSREEPYPVTEMYERLQNYYGLNPKTARPLLAKVDPSIDTIHLFCSNIFSANEFIEPFLSVKESLTDATAIAHLLHSFNITTSRDERVDSMKEIINRLPPLLFELNRVQTTLQLETKEKTSFDDQERERSKSMTLMNDLITVRTCKDHLFTLCSQVERFADPGSCPFDEPKRT